MAQVRIVPKKDMEILNKYLSGEDGVVLIPEDFANKRNLNSLDGEHNRFYAYAGDPDIYVDVVKSDSHTFMHYLNERKSNHEVE